MRQKVIDCDYIQGLSLVSAHTLSKVLEDYTNNYFHLVWNERNSKLTMEHMSPAFILKDYCSNYPNNINKSLFAMSESRDFVFSASIGTYTTSYYGG